MYILYVHTDIYCVWMYALMYGISISHFPSSNINDHFAICALYYLVFI